MKKYDLIVVGGGFSGVAAAISGARAGLKVLIADMNNCFGGAATNGLVNPFMYYWTFDKATDEKVYLCKGIFKEIIDQLKSAGALAQNETTFQEEYLKIILNRMIIKENIDILFNTYLTEVKKEGGRVVSVRLSNKSGNHDFFADYFVDATGDADLAAMAGCSCRLGRESDNLCQPMTLCFRLANVDTEKFIKARETMNGLYQEMQRAGKIQNVRENILYFNTMFNGIIHFNSTRVIKRNPVDAFDLTMAELEAREQVFELYDFLKNNIDGFQESQLISTAMQIGIRESRMIIGKYVLTEDDLISCTKFDDAIAVGNYDIDIHNPEGSGTSHYYFPKGEYYTIPYRCLQPDCTNNLLVAGRCISSTHEAQASYRIMPICSCLGEAAGTAIGIAYNDRVDVNKVDVAKLQSTLKDNGAVVC